VAGYQIYGLGIWRIDSTIIDTLYNMIKDPDAIVVQNVIAALNEIEASYGGIAVNSQMAIYLLNRLKEFNEFG
jgi:AP-4 complex subunit beta-1